MQDDPTITRTVAAAQALDVHLAQMRQSERPRYRRLSALGAGGMGEVWLERDSRIGRDIAIKTLRAVDVPAEQAMRFLREACVQGQLEHPSIVPVYDLGWTDAGAPFFTMRRVRGQTLADVLTALAKKEPEARSRFGQRRLLAAISQVCLALDFAHERGVVHRDVKPANIMLGDHGEVYVLDWGVAKLAGATDEQGAPLLAVESDETPMTSAGSMMGTLSYMSPEQARGDAHFVDARADVYSLGAVLFEALTLHRFVEPGAPETRRQRVIDGIDARISVRLPFLALAPELEDLCVRATRPDPAERMASARELSEGIERFLDGVRDDEMRARRVDSHLSRVRERLDAALAGDAALRAEVSREAGAALALDPDHVEARRAVVALLTHPPPETPPEVEQAIGRVRAEEARRYYQGSLLAAVVYAVLSSAFLAARHHGPLLFASMWAMFVVIIFLSWRGLRGGGNHARRTFLLYCVWMLGAAPALAFGHPLIGMPVVFATGIQVGIRHVPQRLSHWAVLAGALPLLVVTVLAFAHIGVDIGTFSNGQVHLTANLREGFGEILAPLMWIVSILPIFLSAPPIIAMRRQAEAAERALHLSHWQLAQLVPTRSDSVVP